jgi:hypothetical protein
VGVITTNRPTQDWGVFLGDMPATTAIPDGVRLRSSVFVGKNSRSGPPGAASTERMAGPLRPNRNRSQGSREAASLLGRSIESWTEWDRIGVLRELGIPAE